MATVAVVGVGAIGGVLASELLEFHARNGVVWVVSRKGREHGIPTPHSDTVVALLGALSA